MLEELCDPPRQLGLQPLLVRVDPLPATPPARRFSAVERIVLWGVLPVRNRIHVELVPDADGRGVRFAARAALGVRVRSHFALAPIAGGTRTRVRERVELAAPWPLRRFVRTRAVVAQEALLAALARRLAPAGAPAETPKTV